MEEDRYGLDIWLATAHNHIAPTNGWRAIVVSFNNRNEHLKAKLASSSFRSAEFRAEQLQSARQVLRPLLRLNSEESSLWLVWAGAFRPAFSDTGILSATINYCLVNVI